MPMAVVFKSLLLIPNLRPIVPFLMDASRLSRCRGGKPKVPIEHTLLCIGALQRGH